MKIEKPVALDAGDGLPPRLVVPLPLSADKSPPSEMRLFAAGVNLSTKGAFLFDQAAADLVMAEYLARGIEKPADYNHGSVPQTLPGGVVVQPDAERGKAAARYELALRPGPVVDAAGLPTGAMGPELWATNIRWTEEAARRIRAGEYFQTSNAFTHTPEGAVTKFVNFALTNNPAMFGQAPLVAAADDPAATPIKRPKTMKLSDDLRSKLRALAALADADFTDETDANTKLKACLAGVVPAEPAEEKKDAAETKAALAALTGKTTRGEQLAVLSAWKEGAPAIVTLTAERDQARTALKQRELADVIAKGKADAKLTPAMLSDSEVAAPTTSAGKYLKRLRDAGDVEALSAYVEHLPKVVVTEGDREKPGDAPSLLATLTDDEKHVDEIFNLGRPKAEPAAAAK